MINASAPNLEELTLVGLDAPPLDSVSPSHLPGMVKNTQTTRLKHLKLVKHSFRWSSITCFTLTHLTIIRYGLRAEYGCSARDVLHALRRLPLLRNLELEQVTFVSPRSNSMPIQTAVCLRYLRSVRIEADVTVCTTFLNHLSLPALSTLMLHVDSLSGEQEIAELTSCLATRVPFWKDIHTLRLSREGNYGTPMRIHALSEMERGGEHSDGIRRLSSLPYQVGITYFMSLESFHGEEQQICHFIRGLPLATVRELDVAGIYFDEKEEWFTSFEPLNGVTLLRVSCPSNAPPLPNALGQCVSAHSNGSDKSSTLFPYLRVLTLHEACFKDPSLINEYEFMDSLVTCLKWRRERNAGLQELRLTECYNIGASIVEDLRTIVPSVDWDSRVLSLPEADQEAPWETFHPDEDWD
ncbi:hypothetical protein WOLCODRAFT_144443 [Wolfiporia cocos MD-104 SS10]|uniref:F-box domain-containing protein n=1 Tax=Wolfiporia cocos (strain MD-104) TaxID=742152 RepID=A0A2H3JWF2_WOLCO|nr:hypothetical protein WOLCODRAFT_144443 [Wolfiporia cocos MD-104 SS10]